MSNNQLPADVQERIKQQAAYYSSYSEDRDCKPVDKGRYYGYIAGATAEAQCKLKYDELVAENERLKRWKAEALTLLTLVDAYADKHPEIKLGQGKVEFTIARAKERDELKQGNERLKAKVNELMPMVEAMVYYSQIHTVRGVRSAEMPTHEIAWKSAQRWLWDNCKANKLGNYTLKEGESNTPALGEGREVGNEQ